MSQHLGPGQSPSNNKQLVEAMNLLSLTNTCFKTCVMKGNMANKEGADETSSSRLHGVLEYLQIEHNHDQK